jgi:hypothetical protein
MLMFIAWYLYTIVLDMSLDVKVIFVYRVEFESYIAVF